MELCSHVASVTELILPEGAAECAECVKIGSKWVHLRTCQTCGTTLCCDSSPNRHATAHFQATGHPVMASAERGEHWLWCFVHKQLAEY